MIIKELKLPFGTVRVLRNGVPIEFLCKASDDRYNEYWLDDEVRVQAAGCYEIRLDSQDFQIGDELFFCCDAGGLVADSGDEDTCNAVAELPAYTYALGCEDTDEIEWKFGNINGSTPNSRLYGYEKRCVPFELLELTPQGYLYRVVEATLDPDFPHRYLDLKVAWEHSDCPYAFEIVAYLTL